MSLTFAILTALAEEPSTGADLVRRFDRSIGYFWNCTHQQIYRELKHMEADGLVRSEPSVSKPGSNCYTIEQEGEDALIDWIVADHHDTPTRDVAMVKLRALASFEHLDVEQFVAEKRRRHLAKLETYEQLDRRSFSDISARDQFIKKMVLDAGIRRERSYVEWCDNFLRLAASLPRPDRSHHLKESAP